MFKNLLFVSLSLIFTLFGQDEPTILEVVVGNDVVIDLEEKASTGFLWTFYDESFTVGGFISYVSDFTIQNDHGKGGAATHRFVFHAEKPGQATVVLTNVRFGKVDVGAEPVFFEVHVIEETDTGMIHPVVVAAGEEKKGKKKEPKPERDPEPEPVTLEVVVGKDLVIDLEEKGATGFSWTFYDESFLAGGFISYVSDFLVDDGNEGFGTPKTHRFVFHAEKPGSTTLLLTYVRFGKVDVGAEAVPYLIHVIEEADTGMIKPVLLLGQDEPTVVEVVVGEDFNIDMEETPTTGFIWTFYDESFLSGGYLSYIDDYQLDDHGGLGGKVTHRFAFHAEKSGNATILLTLVRFGKVDVGAVAVPYQIHVIEKTDTGMIPPLSG